MIIVLLKNRLWREILNFDVTPFLKSGKKNPTRFIPISWNFKCICKAYCIVHEMQSEIKYVNKKQHFDLKSQSHDESLSLHTAESEPGGSTWTHTQLPEKQQGSVYAWQIPLQAQDYSLPFEAEISIIYAQNEVKKFAYSFPELVSFYHCHSLSNREKNPTETCKKKSYFLKGRTKNYRKSFIKISLRTILKYCQRNT